VDSPPSTVTVPAAPAGPALTIVKHAGAAVDVNGNGITDAGDTIAYTFDVTNTGNVTLSDVGVTDAKAGSVTCPQTTLEPGDSETCTADEPYVITAADVTAGTVHNSATATGTPPSGPPVTSPPDTTDTPTEAPDPSITIVKHATVTPAGDQSAARVGDTIAYTFDVANTGNVTLTDVGVSDAKAGSTTCPQDTLAPGASETCTADASYTVVQGDVDAGSIINTAIAHGTPPTPPGGTTPDPVDSDPSMAIVPTAAAAPAISILKHAGSPVDANGDGITDAGDTIAYTFDVTNTGDVTLTDVGVTDTKAGSVTCPQNTLAPGDTETCTADAPYVITDADASAGTVHNSATAQGTPPTGSPVVSPPSTTDTPVTLEAPDLTIIKHAELNDANGNGVADVGETILYTFEVTNTGNVTLTDVGVTDAKAGAVTCPQTTLAVAAMETCTADAPYTVVQADVDSGSVHNSATAHGTPPTPPGGPTPPPVDSPPSTTDTPTPPLAASLTIVKHAQLHDGNGNGRADVGETITYTFDVTNTGTEPLTDVGVADAKAGSVTCPQATLAVGDTETCTADADYTVTQADADAGVVHNVATAHGTPPTPPGGPTPDPVDSPPSAVDVPTPPAGPAVTIVKKADLDDANGNGRADAGEKISYTFLVTNTGNVTLTHVGVTDAKAGSVTCPQATLAPGDSQTCATDADYTVTQADVDSGVVHNVATAHGTPPTPQDGSTPDPVDSPPSMADVPTPPANPALTLVKHARLHDVNGNGYADKGEAVSYTFDVTNTGNVTMTDIGVVDAKVSGVSCPTSTLAPGESETCAADDYTVTAADVASGSVKNTATATGTPPAGPDGSTPRPVSSLPSTALLGVEAVAVTPGGRPPLALTGVAAIQQLGIAVSLLLGGALLIVVTRRRRQHR
jgi:uncharacterized repeat protein (TIGR01451 family)